MKKNHTNKNHLLEGSVMKSILMISIPVILANTLQTIYQFIDTYWVGRLGTEAVAAVSLSFPILFFLNSLAMGFTMAGSILVARYNGAKDSEKVSIATGQTFSLVTAIAIIVSIIGYFSAEFMLSFLTETPAVLSQATSYLQISFIAMSAMFIFMIFQSTLRGVGKVMLPMIIVLITVIINYFIDPLFMNGWKFIPAMGVSGVALATLLTEVLSAIIGIIILMSGKFGIKLRVKDLYFKAEWIKKIFKMGLPSSLEMSSRSFGMVLMTFLVSTFGTIAVASYGVGIRILTFVIIPAMGFAIATASLVGNNLGAKKIDRAKQIVRTGMYIGFISLSVIGVITFLTASKIAYFIIPNEAETIYESSLFIRIMALSFGFIGIQMIIISTFKAAGQTMTSMFLAMFHSFTIFITGYLLSTIYKLDELGIWIGYPIANVLAVIVAIYFYKKGQWHKKALQ